MPMTRIPKSFWLFFLLIFLETLVSASAFGQLKVNTGEIAGVISDPAGARIAGARIVVTDAARGSQKEMVSDGTGAYRLSLLPPSRYTLEVDAAGFSKIRITPIEVLVGEVVSLSIRLDVSPIQTEVTVQTPTGVLDLQRFYPADIVEAERIELLPINRRNYLDFAVLTPGVAETNVLTDAADFRLAVSPSSGLGFAGLNGRGNSFSIDGISNDGGSGNVRPSLPQAAVQEFQVNRNSYSVEYGGGYGGATNIVTKSGTNAWRGSVFGYLRHRDLQARNYFDPGQKSAYTRIQSGVEAGGPLKPDKTFIFGAFERLDRHESVFVPILEDPGVIDRLTGSQQKIVSFAESSGSSLLQSTAALMRQLLIPTNNPTVRPLFLTNSEVFPFDAEMNQSSVRLDHHFSARDSAFLRANFTRDTQDNTRLGALVGVSHGSQTRWTDQTLVGSNTNYFNSAWMGVTRFGFGNTRFNIKPNEPFGPEVIINGFGTFGRDSLFPYHQHETYIEAQQSFVHNSGKHNLRFGIDINPIRSALDLETFFGGRFVFGEFLPLGLILGVATQNPEYAANVASELVSLGRPELAEGLATPINSLQAYALNLPIFYLQGFGNPKVQRWRQHYSSFVEDAYSIRPGLTLTAGLRHQTDKNPNFPDRTYVVPRAGLAWTPVAGDSLVVRAGSGLFVGWVDLNATLAAYEIMRKDKSLLFVPLTEIPTLNPATGLPVNSADIYGSLIRSNVIGHRAITFGDLTPLGIGPGVSSNCYRRI